jgi:branched-chain amino acid transport system permease protein
MDILPQLIVNSIIAGSIYSVVALGFNLIYGTTKFLDVGYGVLTAVGGYAVFYLANQLELNVWLAIIIAVLFTGLVSYLLDRFVYRTLRSQNASSMVLLLASFGVFTALQALIAVLFGSQFQTLSGGGGAEVLTLAGASITHVQIAIFVTGLGIMSALFWVLGKTMWGKAVRAVSDEPDVAEVVGINKNKVIGLVFFVAGAIGGVAGILVGFDTGIEPTMGLQLLLKGVVAAIVGGMGNPVGGVLGAFLLGFAENFGIWHLPGEWKDAIAFIILIIFLLVRPQGILGEKGARKS